MVFNSIQYTDYDPKELVQQLVGQFARLDKLKSKEPTGYIENGIIVNLMIPEQATELIKGIYQLDPQTIETTYPGTTAKMFVVAGPEAASAYVLFIRNEKIVSIEIPVNSNDDGSGSTEIPEIYKSAVDLIMSSIQVK